METADHGLNPWAKINLLCFIIFLECLSRLWKICSFCSWKSYPLPPHLTHGQSDLLSYMLALPLKSPSSETFLSLAASFWATSSWVSPLRLIPWSWHPPLISQVALVQTLFWYPGPPWKSCVHDWGSLCSPDSHVSFSVPSWDECETGDCDS